MAPVSLIVSLVLMGKLRTQKAEFQRQLSRFSEEQAAVLLAAQNEMQELRVAKQDALGKIEELEQAIVELVKNYQLLAESSPENKIYTRAAKMVELGATVEEIMEECELPRAEAEMIINFHRK